MKKIGLLLASAFFCVAGLYLGLAQAQGDCCQPPVRHEMVPRFPQNVTVNVYIDSSSGFTVPEMNNIETGFLDWNGQPNNSGITYNVTKTSSLPAPNTANTIVVRYDDNPGQTGIAGTQVFSSGPAVSMSMVFHQNIRYGVPEYLPSFLRGVSRHEAGHGLGLDNAPKCPPGSTIMNLNADANEDMISPCDNNGINTDPAYPPPSNGL